jgi:hypothetical protein
VLQNIESFMSHVTKFCNIALDDVIKYTPEADIIANAVAPEYKLLEDVAARGVIAGCTLLKNTIVLTQQKYAGAAKGDTTNQTKLADAIAAAGPAALLLFQQAGLKVDDARLTNIISAIVQIMKSNQVPVDATGQALPTVDTTAAPQPEETISHIAAA